MQKKTTLLHDARYIIFKHKPMHTPTFPGNLHSGLDGLLKNLSSTLPDWAQQASQWLSEAPVWASAILKQSAMVFEIVVNEQMIQQELTSHADIEKCLLYRMSGHDKFRLHAMPGTADRLRAWVQGMPEDQQDVYFAKTEQMIARIPEVSAPTMQQWEHVRNIFPVLGNTKSPFMGITFRFGDESVTAGTDIPNPSSFKIWDLANTGKMISRIEQGAVTFYLCELNLTTLTLVLSQVMTVVALSVIKWIGKTLHVLADVLKGSFETIKQIPREVLLSLLGVMAISLLIPGIRNTLQEWLQKSGAWIQEIWTQLLTWLQTWIGSVELFSAWLESLGLVAGLLTETVWQDIKAMIFEMLQKGPEGGATSMGTAGA